MVFVGFLVKPFKKRKLLSFAYWASMVTLTSFIFYAFYSSGWSWSFLIVGILLYPFIFMLEELKEFFDKIVDNLSALYQIVKNTIKSLVQGVIKFLRVNFKVLRIILCMLLGIFAGILFSDLVWHYLDPFHSILLALGILIGYHMYNKYGLTTQVSKTIELYSKVLVQETKTIKNIKIYKLDQSIDTSWNNIIEAFEILENFSKIEDMNYKSFREYLKHIAESYDDDLATDVLKKMKYKKRTIAFLEMILQYYNVNNSLSKYLARTSKYNIPTMEEINEIAS